MALHSVVLPMPLRPTMAMTPRSSVKLDALQRVGAAVVDVEAAEQRTHPRAGRW